MATLAGAALAGAALAAPRVARAAAPISIGLTPVMLDSDQPLLAALGAYLTRRLDAPVALVTKRTYQEISALLLAGQIDAAWICGYPYVQHRARLQLLAVPVYEGVPLYRSYLLVSDRNRAQTVQDLAGQMHAFSDPDSNSGFLVTRHLLWTMGTTPAAFFKSSFFAYGHRNVIRAVAAGLADCGSVDGYVWEVVGTLEPQLTARTRVLRRSPLHGFPPIVCGPRVAGTALAERVAAAFVSMASDSQGREVLGILRLDGFVRAETSLFDTIAAMMADVGRPA